MSLSITPYFTKGNSNHKIFVFSSKSVTCSWHRKNKTTNRRILRFCYVFLAVLPEVEISILIKKTYLQPLKFVETGFVGEPICRFVVWFFWCHEHITALVSSNMPFSLLVLGKDFFFIILRLNNFPFLS